MCVVILGIQAVSMSAVIGAMPLQDSVPFCLKMLLYVVFEDIV